MPRRRSAAVVFSGLGRQRAASGPFYLGGRAPVRRQAASSSRRGLPGGRKRTDIERGRPSPRRPPPTPPPGTWPPRCCTRLVLGTGPRSKIFRHKRGPPRLRRPRMCKFLGGARPIRPTSPQRVPSGRKRPGRNQLHKTHPSVRRAATLGRARSTDKSRQRGLTLNSS